MKSITELNPAQQHQIQQWHEPTWLLVHQQLPSQWEQLAHQSRALLRCRKVNGATALLRSIFAYVLRDWSLRMVGAWACLEGLADLSDVAWLYRFRQCQTWLGLLLGQLLQERNAELCQLGGVRLRILDATVITQPGSQGTDWRLHLSFDLGRMSMDGVEITDAHGGESLLRFAPRADEIYVGDRAYATPAGLGYLLVGAARCVVRISWSNPALYTPSGERLDLIGWLRSLSQRGEREVQLSTPRGTYTLRLIACPLPSEQAAQARERVSKQASKKGKTVHPNTWWAAGYILLLSNLPSQSWEASRVLWVYRVRWQIELQFKRLKSLLHLDQLRAHDPRLAQTYLLGKLLAALLLERWVQQVEVQHTDLFASLQRPVSLWRLQTMLWASLCDALVGRFSLAQVLAAMPSLARYLCDPPRTRTQQLAWARRFFARLSGI